MKSITMLLLACLLSAASAAGLKFDEVLKELDVEPTEQIVTTDFTFKNTSDKPVRIAKYDAACSCMSLKVKGGKLLYQPGESGVIRAVFDMGNFSGVVDKVLQVWLDDDPEPEPSVLLTVRVDIPVLIEVLPKTLRWDLNDPTEKQVVKITMNYPEPIRVLEASTNTDAFTTKLTTIEEGKSYELEVTPASTERPALGIIQIKTDCPIERHAIKRTFALVRQPVSEELPEREKSRIPR